MTDINKEKLWNKDYITIMIAACGISFTTHFFLTTLPIYAQKISSTAAYAGFMTGAYTLSALAVRPLSGILTDKIGRVKMLMFGAMMCAVACISYKYTGSIILLIALRVLNGIGFGAHSTAAGAVAADVIPKQRLMEGMGYFGIYGTIAQAIAPAIAITIVSEGGTERFTFLFVLAAAISIVSMVLDYTISYERKRKIAAVFRENEPAGDKNKSSLENGFADQKKSAEEKPVKTFFGFEYGAMLPALVILLVFMGQSSVMSFLALYANEEKIGNIGFFYPILAAGMLISRIFAGRIGDKYGSNVIIIPSIAVCGLCYLAMPFIHSLAMLLPVAFPVGMSLGAVSPALNSLIIKRTSPTRRGSASATYFSAVDIGVGVGSIIFGFIIASLGFTFLFIGSFTSVLCALLIYIFFLAKKV